MKTGAHETYTAASVSFTIILRSVQPCSLFALASPVGLVDHSDVVYIRHDVAARASLETVPQGQVSDPVGLEQTAYKHF